ncbi:MAG: glycosyltransferase family 1 protein [Nitrospirae bacterium]|nr:MAG: glycosyltransferase family 1 protein [Nitrospirota bacterium]
MRIIYPLPEIIPDGRARFIQIMNTTHALSKAGVKTHLLAGRKRGKTLEDIKRFYHLPEDEGPDIEFLPILRKNIPLLSVSWGGVFEFFLFRYIRKQRGILFVRHPKLAFSLLKRRHVHKLPLIFEAHEIFSLSAKDPVKQKRLSEMERFIYTNADGVITISTKLKEDLADIFGLRPERASVIPNAIRDDWLSPDPAESQREGMYIFYAGSLYRWKGVDTLLDAIKLLPDEELIIAGGGARLQELKRYAKASGISHRVNFVGTIPQREVMRYLERAKAAVVPNLEHKPSEYSSPLKLFEFMGAGIPVVASDLPGIRDVVRDKEEALLFRPGDPRDLAEKIECLSRNPSLSKSIGSMARKRAEDFTYSKRAEKIIGFIRELNLTDF